MTRMQHHLKEIVDEDVVAAPEEIMDVIAIIFGDVMVIILNQMKIIHGDMKRERTHHLQRNLKIIVIDAVWKNIDREHIILPNI
jgi:hypothetical protein